MGAVNVKSGLRELLTPDNCCVLFIDHQPAMTFGVATIDRQTLLNNVLGLAKAARTFNVPVILTSVESASFSGAVWPQLTSLFPTHRVYERSSMNSWEDAALVAAVKQTGRQKLLIAALWTEVCLAFPALCALADGYDVYAVEDCSGGTTQLAHDAALNRIVQAGGVRTTWVCTMLEWQRDWARRATYDQVMQTVIEVSRYSTQRQRAAHTAHHSRTHTTQTQTIHISSCERSTDHTFLPVAPCVCVGAYCALCLLSTAARTVRPWSTATRWCTRRRHFPSAWQQRRQQTTKLQHTTATVSIKWRKRARQDASMSK